MIIFSAEVASEKRTHIFKVKKLLYTIKIRFLDRVLSDSDPIFFALLYFAYFTLSLSLSPIFPCIMAGWLGE